MAMPSLPHGKPSSTFQLLLVMLTNHQSPVSPHGAAPHLELQELGPDTVYSQWQQLPTYSLLWIQQGVGRYNAALHNSPFESTIGNK